MAWQRGAAEKTNCVPGRRRATDSRSSWGFGFDETIRGVSLLAPVERKHAGLLRGGCASPGVRRGRAEKTNSGADLSAALPRF